MCLPSFIEFADNTNGLRSMKKTWKTNCVCIKMCQINTKSIYLVFSEYEDTAGFLNEKKRIPLLRRSWTVFYVNLSKYCLYKYESLNQIGLKVVRSWNGLAMQYVWAGGG